MMAMEPMVDRMSSVVDIGGLSGHQLPMRSTFRYPSVHLVLYHGDGPWTAPKDDLGHAGRVPVRYAVEVDLVAALWLLDVHLFSVNRPDRYLWMTLDSSVW